MATRPGLREGIAALLRGESPDALLRGEPPDGGRWVDAGPAGAPADLGELPGAETVGASNVLALRRPVDDLLPGSDLSGEIAEALARLRGACPHDVYPGLRPAIGRSLDELVFLDLETTGFWGCPIFLVGLLLVDEGGRLVTLQLLARDYPEEAGILREAVSLLKKRGLLVSFNGKSYDVPCFTERAAYHRVPSSLRRLAHVDVLHPARRAWKGRFVDCRLTTLEKQVADIWRDGDVPSWEIPAVYHDFTATGDVESLVPVLHHGRVDLVTTARLFARLVEDPPRPGRRRRRRRPK